MAKIPSQFIAATLLAGLTACATLSPRSRVESELISLGVAKPRAECLAGELAHRLNGRDMRAVADFLGGLRRNNEDDVVDSLSGIGNPRAAAAIAGAGIACAIGG